ncbi:F-box only protein 5 [Vanacampus margaritifer]
MCVCVFDCEDANMKCLEYDIAKAKKNMERGSPEKPLGLFGKDSPTKDPHSVKPPTDKVSKVLFPHNNSLGAAHDKENKTVEAREDSGYLSLYNSHTDEGEDHSWGNPMEVLLPLPPLTVTPKQSGCPVSLGAPSTPMGYCRRKQFTYSLSSTPREQYDNSKLPIIKFQQAVWQELAKDYSLNKRYDWSILSKVAKDHQLHLVIGRGMGLQFVDMFSSLLSKNMRHILANILSLLGDMDLISCKKVSRTWRKIIREDRAAQKRCRQAKKMFQESLSSVKLKSSSLTRNMVASRVVLSCIQKVASPHPPSALSSSFSGGVNRRNASAQKNSQSNSQCSRFNEFIQAASTLKQDESLRPCMHCGSPAMYSPGAQRATCMRPSCHFDFCTLCLEAFHGATPCRVVQCRSRYPTSGSTYSVLPGSAQSKKNIRRL